MAATEQRDFHYAPGDRARIGEGHAVEAVAHRRGEPDGGADIARGTRHAFHVAEFFPGGAVVGAGDDTRPNFGLGGGRLDGTVDVDAVDFERRGAAAVLIARLLPVVRTFIALPAGIARMPRLKFHIYTFVGSWPWCFVLAYIGMRLGEQWDKDPRLKMWFHRLDAIILAVIVVAVVYFVWSHLQHRVGRDHGPKKK